MWVNWDDFRLFDLWRLRSIWPKLTFIDLSVIKLCLGLTFGNWLRPSLEIDFFKHKILNDYLIKLGNWIWSDIKEIE